MSVFYKFKSALTFDTIQFDDLHISLQDFKKAVIHQKQLGKHTNFDLQVTNAETNEIYSEENSLIPKNSSLIVVRVPLAGSQKKPWEIGDQFGSKVGIVPSDYLQENAGNIVVKSADLAALNASEDDKIQAMMFQSTVDYDPSNYMRVKGGNQFGDPPPNYICHKCHHPGHWIKDCPITIVPDIKKSSGIPQSFMTPVEGPSVPGALMTPSGTFAVPTIDMEAYKEGKKEKPFIPSEEIEESSKPIIPEDLLCTLCQDLLNDAVMMPCCGISFCDECIRNVLIESEENQCPDCKEKDTSPETLIPNRFLRNAVNKFRNETGYKGGGHHHVTQKIIVEPVKSPTIIDIDQDSDIEHEKEKGSAISVLNSDIVHRRNIASSTPGKASISRRPTNVPPIVTPNYPPPNVNPIMIQQSIPPQSSVRMYPSYSNTPVYSSQIDSGYRNGHGSYVRMHVDNYREPNTVVDDPWELFERHLREREKQDRLRRHRSRRTRSRSHSRIKSRTRSRSRSWSRSPSIKRSHSKSPIEFRRESSLKKRKSRSPLHRRSKSKSRSRTRMRSRSRTPSRKTVSRSISHSPKKRSVSLSPSLARSKKRTRSPTPIKRSHRSRTRTRTRSRSTSISRSRKRRKSRSRSRSICSRRSLSRGRSYSRSISPIHRSRALYSPNFSHRGKRYSRSPPSRYYFSSRFRGGNSRDHSIHTPYYEYEHRGYRRGFRNFKYNRGNRYMHSSSNYEAIKLDNFDRYEEKHYLDSNNSNRGYFTSGNDHTRNRKDPLYTPITQPPPTTTEPFSQYDIYTEVQPPGTTDMIPTDEYNVNYVFNENSNSGFISQHDDKYRNPEYGSGGENGVYASHSNLKEILTNNNNEWKKTKDWDKDKNNDYNHRKSRDEHHAHHYTDYENRRHGSSHLQYVTLSPSTSSRSNERKHKSRGRSRDKENKPMFSDSTSHNKMEKMAEYSGKHELVAGDIKKETVSSPKKQKQPKKDDDEKKDDYKDKKDKLKRKKKKESETEKKKKKKLKSVKKEDEVRAEEKNNEEMKQSKDESFKKEITDITNTENTGNEDWAEVQADLKLTINEEKPLLEGDVNTDSKNVVMAVVPELSKWERDDAVSPSDEQKSVMSKICEMNDKKLVTSEILKRAENVLFQKIPKTSKTVVTDSSKGDVISSKEKDETLSATEGTREARKSGNSIQVTVAASNDIITVDDERSRPVVTRISAKDRLGAKVEEKNYKVRSLVEPKIKPRPLQSTVKAVNDAKYSTSKVDSYKHEKFDSNKTKKYDDKKRNSYQSHSDSKHNRRHHSKERKDRSSKHTSSSSSSSHKITEDSNKSKKTVTATRDKTSEKEKPVKEDVLKHDETFESNESLHFVEIDDSESKSYAENKSEIDKKRPSIDEFNFEPDYDLTESEEEAENIPKESNEQVKITTDNEEFLAGDNTCSKSDIGKVILQKIIDRTKNLTSSDSSSDSSSSSSSHHKKHKKKKSKRKKKVKKRKNYSSDSDSDDSSDSDSDSDTKRKRKKKHKHKYKKSKVAKKRKKSKHKL